LRFKAQLRLTTSEGGRRQTPAAVSWRPIFRVTDEGDGTSFFLEAVDGTLEPGASCEVWASLLSPHLFAGQILPNVRFGLYEGPRRVADGVILEVMQQD